ncbi:LLM class flavin-dependent oxidoreductase [Pontibaca methylaminivorans]|uniref:Luciferase-like monooxygenase n=1 Tax=Pontibaca methylaminivorans TaxID=515897 RepID=A0A1R3WY43_9RHOB|nr:LLM class flavin-dependent oxidoreductase [Pontibaca methylaminivorans]SIT83199.1 luciferase family oxidoreductase, group 1 [Pontibaca methylaminivorans]
MRYYSLLDLSPVSEGSTTAAALSATLDLARDAERLGYHRFWLAEHHNMTGIASAATAVLIGQVAAATERIRVGAGGIMLPNHAPLMVAEQFGTLATLFPGRIDLGLGRAPGTDTATARALRRYFESADSFPQDVVELLGYLGETPEDAKVQAVPGQGTHVPVWILGSSLFGAQLAAHLGLPYAFASHFAPMLLEEALASYRHQFRPSPWLDRPYVMIAANVFAAPSDEEARVLRSSQLLSFARLRMGKPGRLPHPIADPAAEIAPGFLAQAEQALSVSATGAPATVERELAAIIKAHRPDELMVSGMIHDPEARRRSFAIAAEALERLVEERPEAG